MLGRSGGVAILLLCWCGSCQSLHAVVVQQQIPTSQQVRPSNKIEKKSPMRSTLLRAVVAKQRIRPSEIENESRTGSTLSFAPSSNEIG